MDCLLSKAGLSGKALRAISVREIPAALRLLALSLFTMLSALISRRLGHSPDHFLDAEGSMHFLSGRSCRPLGWAPQLKKMDVHQSDPIPSSLICSLMRFITTCIAALHWQAMSSNLADRSHPMCMLMMSSCSPGWPQGCNSC